MSSEASNLLPYFISPISYHCTQKNLKSFSSLKDLASNQFRSWGFTTAKPQAHFSAAELLDSAEVPDAPPALSSPPLAYSSLIVVWQVPFLNTPLNGIAT